MDYSRQQSLNLHIPRSIWIVGCGGVGYWTGMTFALAGVPEITLFDHDEASDSNRNRVPYQSGDINAQKTKSEILQEHILKIRPDAIVVSLGHWSQDWAGSLARPEWLIATTDTHASRTQCFEWAKRNRVKYLEAAAEGEFGSITGSPADFATPEESMPGYASIPVWAGPCMAAAYLAAAYVLHGHNPNSRSLRLGFNPTDGQATLLNR